MGSRSGRIIAAFIIIALTISAFAGCKKKDKEVPFEPKLAVDSNASITVYGSYSNFEALESEFERFNAYYPNVSMSYVYLDGYNDAIANSLRGNEAPDIFCTFYWMWNNPKCTDIFEAAADLAAADTGINFSCVRQSLIRKTDSGEVLMAPILATSCGMLVNMDLFKKEGLKVPTTWSEFEDAINTTTGGQTIQWRAQWAVGEYDGSRAWLYIPDYGALGINHKYNSCQVRPLLASKRV